MDGTLILANHLYIDAGGPEGSGVNCSHIANLGRVYWERKGAAAACREIDGTVACCS